MLFALIRPAETRTATAEGTELPALREQLKGETPPGWDMVSAHVEMKPGGIRIVEGKFRRRDEPQEIEAEDMVALEAQVPEGWEMLSVRRS
ncbi:MULTISPECIES: hypothetical protein [unclassified Microbacterium]|uniref:hypothetical protein n=1 Tax=unclassified Microbacterium TaxID=2609290 RepID=UPI000EA871B0|nr:MULTISPECIES: hypothetical protein [unclassified Microbacterium]MBT2486066.1 hypothetical protein [Microbacterium sp. ISL-108]RKN68801.1 hypothetical protein D7252_15270 [Microbacterium sp. CGR2]